MINEYPRTSFWKLKTRCLEFVRPVVMGILNVTPDSFSDGGRFFVSGKPEGKTEDALLNPDGSELPGTNTDPDAGTDNNGINYEAAIQQGLRMVEQGAGIIDVGGESTRPGAVPVSVEEELRRVVPVVRRLAALTDVPVSVDTCHARVAWESVRAGAEIINDITACEGDSDMPDVVRETGAAVCLMHMQGTPRDMQNNPTYHCVTEEVFQYLQNRRERLIASGTDPEKIAVDPGIGFGKNFEHNRELLVNVEKFHELGAPILIGHSRKTFLKQFWQRQSSPATGEDVPVLPTLPELDYLTAFVSAELVRHGVQVIRVHNVPATRRFIDLQTLLSFNGVAN